MNTGRIRTLLFAFLLISLGLSACVGPGGSPAPTVSAATMMPAKTAISATDVSQAPSGSYCDDDKNLVKISFTKPEPAEGDNWKDTWSATGEFKAEEPGQPPVDVQIILRGRNPDPIIKYIEETRFCFEFEPIEEVKEEPGDEEKPLLPDELRRMILMDDNATGENLVIEIIQLNEPDPKDKPAGYLVKYVIDPTVINGATHDYSRTCTSSASVTTDTRAPGYGSERTTLYKITVDRNVNPNRVTTATRQVTVSAGGSGTVSNSGSATYDLSVYGLTSPNTKYRVTGKWYKNYSDSAPSGGGVNCP